MCRLLKILQNLRSCKYIYISINHFLMFIKFFLNYKQNNIYIYKLKRKENINQYWNNNV
jgi:hypothetical protein